MVNQQAKTTDLAWLAGILDGEGSFMIIRPLERRSGNGFHPINGGYIPAMKVGMCHQRSIERMAEVMDTIPVGHYGPYRQAPKGNVKEVWNLQVKGMKRMLTLMYALQPYSITKEKQLVLLLEYSELRKSHSHLDPITPREAEIIDIFRNPFSPQRLNARPDNRLRQMQAVPVRMV